jgi:hypothetical protein
MHVYVYVRTSEEMLPSEKLTAACMALSCTCIAAGSGVGPKGEKRTARAAKSELSAEAVLARWRKRSTDASYSVTRSSMAARVVMLAEEGDEEDELDEVNDEEEADSNNLEEILGDDSSDGDESADGDCASWFESAERVAGEEGMEEGGLVVALGAPSSALSAEAFMIAAATPRAVTLTHMSSTQVAAMRANRSRCSLAGKYC